MNCPDAVVIGNQCKHYGSKGICKLPKRVYCMLYEGSNRKGPVKSISPTSVDAYRNCHMKWLNQSYKRLTVPDTSQALAAGSVGHMALAEYYKSGSVNLNLVEPVLSGYKIRNYDETKYKTLSINIAALLENYFSFYPDGEFPGSEVERELPILDISLPNGYSLHGFVDMWIPQQNTVIEHKFLDSLDLSPLAYKTQKVAYFIATGADHIIFNVLRKPATRPKRGENFSDYKCRVDDDIKSRPAEFFKRIVVNRSDFDIPAESKKLMDVMDEINTRLSSEQFDENTSHCQFLSCGYEPICLTGQVGEEFRVEEPQMKTTLKIIESD